MLSLSRILALLLLAGPTAWAAGGTNEYELDWPQQDEALMYRSCGCADACWVAEVRERSSQQVKARLRCDCSELSYSADGAAEQPLAESCAAINAGPDKGALIGAKLRELHEAQR